jgi:putative FmdB family regulatory protein
MPIFEYRCTACHETCELIVLSAADVSCPGCGSTSLEKLVSAPAAHGRTARAIQSARAQAAREGHFSHYSAPERAKL